MAGAGLGGALGLVIIVLVVLWLLGVFAGGVHTGCNGLLARSAFACSPW